MTIGDLRPNYRSLSDEEQTHIKLVKNAGNELIRIIRATAPISREVSLAITKVEEAVMWATKGITL